MILISDDTRQLIEGQRQEFISFLLSVGINQTGIDEILEHLESDNLTRHDCTLMRMFKAEFKR